jgi:adenylate cyclase
VEKTELRRRILAFLREASRRKVYSTAIAYAAVSVALITLGHALFDALLFPEWTPRLLTVLMLLGFPVVLILAWIFDFGPEGLRRTETLAAQPAPAAPPDRLPGGAKMGGGPRLSGGTGLAGAAGIRIPIAPLPSRRATPREERTPPPVAPAEPPDPERVRRVSLAHVRHELRTPINAIIGYSEMLADDLAETGEASTLTDLRRIQTAGRELLALVERILDPERIGQEDRSLDQYGQDIQADLRTPVTTVIGYAEMLIESAHENGDDALAADLERIRDSGRRLLELSSDIVAVATSATHTAPAVAEASAMATGVLAKIQLLGTERAEEREGSLLVVDDNESNRDLLSRQLARRGYLVATAKDGQEALAQLEEREFDLVLLDIFMPGMDGIETLRRIKAAPRWAEVPVIMISSLDEIEAAIRCLEIGAEDYLTKPFHPTILEARIGACLELRRMRERTTYYETLLERDGATIERLLRSVFPAPIADRVRRGETGILESYAEATVLWCDLDSSIRCGRIDPVERAARLEWLLALLESEARARGIEMVLPMSPGLVIARLADYAAELVAPIAELALAAMEAARTADGDVHLRFGLHIGAAAGGVIRTERLLYCLWGDAVDLARRLEAQAPAGGILVSPAAYALLKDGFSFTNRGVVNVAGRGQMRAYLLTGHAASAPAEA